MSKGAVFFLAIFPIISIFPIPQQEIKKIENIKKEYIKKVDENGEPLDEDDEGSGKEVNNDNCNEADNLPQR